MFPFGVLAQQQQQGSPSLELPASPFVHLDASNPTSWPGSGTTWYDLSGNSNDFTLSGSPPYNAALGGGVFEFAGSTGSYAQRTSNLDLRTSPYTVAYVARYGSGSKGRVVGSGGIVNWLAGFHAGRSGVYHPGSWVYETNDDGTVWQHITATGDTGTDLWQYFKNGVAMAPANSNGFTGPYGIRIGGDGTYPTEYSDCDVGWLVIYDRVLTPEEITQLHDYIRDRYSL